MNTADRSIALLDTALRRRFGFVELMPDPTVLGDTIIEGIPLGPWLKAINRLIVDHLGRAARNLQIGHSYFMDGAHPIMTFPRLAQVLRDDIIPLLEEYTYEDFASLEKILGKDLIDAQQQRVHHELFESPAREKLIQALRAIDPNLESSAETIHAAAKAVEDEKALIQTNYRDPVADSHSH